MRLNQDDDAFYGSLLLATYADPAAGAPESHALLHDAPDQMHEVGEQTHGRTT